jgi:diacylglycerol kinase family enzyme
MSASLAASARLVASEFEEVTGRVSHTTQPRDEPERRPSLRHRTSAVASIVCLAGALVLGLFGAVRGMPEVLVPLALGLVAMWCAWKALSHWALRRAVYAAAGAVTASAAILDAALFTSQFPSMLAAVVLLALAAVLAGSALSWAHQPAGRLVGPARHPVLIVNPRSGGGAAARAGVADEARRRGIRVIELSQGDDLAEIARRAARGGADALGMAGGDGSLALVAGVAMEAHIPFVCVPAGTRNHFALDLGLDRNDPIGALDAFGEAVQRRIDVAAVNGRRFLNNVSIGAYGEVVASEDYRDNKIGVALQTLPDLIGPNAEPLDLRFTDGTGTEHPSAVVIHVSNNSYDLGPHLGFGSRPSLIDGELGVVAVVKEGDLVPPRVISWQVARFVVESDVVVLSGIDGEFVELAPPVRFDVEPMALRVRMSRDALGVSPAAKRPSLTARTLRRLVAVARGRYPLDDVTRLREAPAR